MKKFVNLIPLIILVLITVVGILAIYETKKQNDLNSKFERGDNIILPEFSFKNLYKGEENLTNLDFRGKYSLLNIFASWCSTCHLEHDTLVKISKDGNIDIYGIAYNDIDENTKKYLKNNQNPYQKVGVSRGDELLELFSIQGIPETFLIDKKGQIIYRHQGTLTKDVANYLISKYVVDK